MQQAFFVTGTDTDVGKTTVSAGLLAAARMLNLSTLACKVVASGCVNTEAGLRSPDALALAEQSSIKLPYTRINPIALAPAIAPHIAAQQAGISLCLSQLTASCEYILQQRAQFTLFEGAGGWRTPINQSHSLADLACQLRLPVILIVGIKLGCINHALLSAEAIQATGLPLAGWIANCQQQADETQQANISYLSQQLKAPCLAVIPAQRQPVATNLAPLLQQVLASLCASYQLQPNGDKHDL